MNKVSTNRGLIDFVVIAILGNAFIMTITRKDRSSRPELFQEKVFWIYANLQKNTNAEVRFLETKTWNIEVLIWKSLYSLKKISLNQLKPFMVKIKMKNFHLKET